eukprot:1195851-Prorocentrum_minimum.AAC.18
MDENSTDAPVGAPCAYSHSFCHPCTLGANTARTRPAVWFTSVPSSSTPLACITSPPGEP